MQVCTGVYIWIHVGTGGWWWDQEGTDKHTMAQVSTYEYILSYIGK